MIGDLVRSVSPHHTPTVSAVATTLAFLPCMTVTLGPPRQALAISFLAHHSGVLGSRDSSRSFDHMQGFWTGPPRLPGFGLLEWWVCIWRRDSSQPLTRTLTSLPHASPPCTKGKAELIDVILASEARTQAKISASEASTQAKI